ncbi:MAG: RluA family pseudouridine synthase [candidate division Zixibacteria bacterium]|nr:RluA family pseudouridine synthase [candidate division Zixibacteria bacterium]
MNRLNREKAIIVPPGVESERLDRYLTALSELELSRSQIQRLIDDGLVLVDGQAETKNHRLRGGEKIVITIPPPEEPNVAPENIPLNIVYEDEYLAVIDKPYGLVVHPAPGNPEHTLVNALLYHLKQVAPDETGLRPGIIHRLDKNTSGLLMVAKDEVTARKLREQLAAREVTKIYRAVVCGHMPEAEGTIDLPVGRSLRDRTKMTVTKLHSREAITRYTVITSYRLLELVDVQLVTGRTHQIRVHFTHLNHPVFGDPEYGGRLRWLRGIDPARRNEARKLLDLIDRQALHARSLTFVHPATGREMTFTSELPDDMKRLVDYLDATEK